MTCRKTSQLDPPTLLPGGMDDCFYQYAAFDSKDASPAYFGHKVLAVSYGGTINLSGYKGAQGGNDNDPSVLSSSWQRLNSTLKGGGTESSFQIGTPVTDWMNGDNIVVTSTDYLPGHAEQMQVSIVSGNTVNLVGKVRTRTGGRPILWRVSRARIRPMVPPPAPSGPTCFRARSPQTETLTCGPQLDC